LRDEDLLEIDVAVEELVAGERFEMEMTVVFTDVGTAGGFVKRRGPMTGEGLHVCTDVG
jgi:hypothetical protein